MNIHVSSDLSGTLRWLLSYCIVFPVPPHTHLMLEDIPELIVREVAENVGTRSLKDTYHPREGASRSEDNDGEFTGPLHAVPLVLLLVLTALLLASTICTIPPGVPSGMTSGVSFPLETLYRNLLVGSLQNYLLWPFPAGSICFVYTSSSVVS